MIGSYAGSSRTSKVASILVTRRLLLTHLRVCFNKWKDWRALWGYHTEGLISVVGDMQELAHQ